MVVNMHRTAQIYPSNSKIKSHTLIALKNEIGPKSGRSFRYKLDPPISKMILIFPIAYERVLKSLYWRESDLSKMTVTKDRPLCEWVIRYQSFMTVHFLISESFTFADQKLKPFFSQTFCLFVHILWIINRPFLFIDRPLWTRPFYWPHFDFIHFQPKWKPLV